MHSLLPVLLALATASASPQASAADTKAKVDAIFRDVDRSDSPGCALGVYRDGQIAYARGYGMANLELNVGNTPQTVFDIGSVSKQFTAIAIHLLAREGKLSLDDDIRKWVPRDPVLRKDGDAPPPAPPHRRPARLHRADEPPGHGRGGPLSRVGRARDHGPAEGPEFRAGRGLPLLQHGLQPARARRGEGQRAVPARLFRAADLRAPRHAPHADQRLPHADHPQPRHRLPEGGRGLRDRDVRLGADGRRRRADDGRGPLSLEPELLRAESGRREAHRRDAGSRRAEQRQEDRLRLRACASGRTAG